jgi:hypothetical protein
MASVPIEVRGTLYDLQTKSSRQVFLVGEASLSGVGVGGGPIIPPDKPPGSPPGIWGPTDPRPNPPIAFPPGWVGGVPPGGWPPDGPPPNVEVPPPGSPPLIVSGTHPTHPITPPPAVVIDYPGIGKVVVPQPTDTTGNGSAGTAT